MDRFRVSTEICGRPSHICCWWKMSGFPIMTKAEPGHRLQKDFIWWDTVLFIGDPTCSDFILRFILSERIKLEGVATPVNKIVFLVDKVNERFWFAIQSECFNLLSLYFLCATRFCVLKWRALFWRALLHLACTQYFLRIPISEATLILEVVQYLLSTNLNLVSDHVIILILDHLWIVSIDLTHDLPFSVTLVPILSIMTP